MTENTNQKIYGIDCGILIARDNEEWESYAINKELTYGFYDEDQYVCLEEDLKETIHSLKEYVKTGVDMTYAIVSLQGKCHVGDDTYKNIKNNEYNTKNMDYSHFSEIQNVVWSACKINGEITECFLENALKKQNNNTDNSSVLTTSRDIAKAAEKARRKANDEVPQGTYNAAWLHGYAAALTDVANQLQMPEEIQIVVLRCYHESRFGINTYISIHPSHEKALEYVPKVKKDCEYDANRNDEDFDFTCEFHTLKTNDYFTTKKED